MLNELTIENVAVIERATAFFDNGFNVLTGETGAGKSIIIDALNAILGNRLSKDIIRTGEDKASIFARFTELSKDIIDAFSKAGYEITDDELIIQRVITKDGKGGARINGMPVASSLLKELAFSLVNIHGQHDNQNLLNPSKHIEMLDNYASTQNILSNYKDTFSKLQKNLKELTELNLDEQEKIQRVQLLTHQINEIEEKELKPGEEQQLNKRKHILLNSKKIIDSLDGAYALMSGDDDNKGLLDLISLASSSIAGVSTIDSELSTIYSKLNEHYYPLEEIMHDIKNKMLSFEQEPNEIDEIEERLSEIYKLKQKYGDSIESILKTLNDLRQKLVDIEFLEEKTEKLRAEQTKLKAVAKEQAAELTQKRLAAFDKLNNNIKESLEFLNMKSAELSLLHSQTLFTRTGRDNIEFYIKTNRGEAPKPLSKIASGGELSRIMLAIKSVFSNADNIDTVIFDEIDTGVSGSAAAKIGQKLYEVSRGKQVICVTHTSQIASYADSHLYITKNEKENRTYTEIQNLSLEMREQELARITSGDSITKAALLNAKDMLQVAKGFKNQTNKI